MEIMATTTNNHNQKELRLYAPNDQQQQQQQATTTTLAVATTATGARSPFQREVREWQRIDPDTGALLTGRLEADRWINGPLNKYGKISDSKNISKPNGTQQTQRKQLEVLQTCTAAGGAMQVIRSQTVQTTSSRWSTSSASATASPLLLSASTSPIPQLQQQQKVAPNSKSNNNNISKHNNLKQKTHNSSKTNTITSSATTNHNTTKTSTPFIVPTLLTNGFPHNHQHHHNFNQPQQFPHSLVNGTDSSRNRNWPDITENMSTLDICDNDHDNEHDHDNDYIVQHSSEDDNDDVDDDMDNDSLIDDINDVEVDVEDDDEDHHDDHHNQYLVNKRNNLKNKSNNDSFTNKRHSFTVLANDHKSHSNNDHINTSTTSTDHHHHHHQHHNLSRDSSSGSCSNQLFLLDTAPSLKLSNLMKSSSSISNSSNNSTTASQATAAPSTVNPTNPSSSMNTHKSMASKISLHAIVGNNNTTNTATNTMKTTTSSSSSTPSPTSTITTRPSWQQPTIYRQNSQSNNIQSSSNNSHTNLSHNQNYSNNNNSHLMTTRVGDNNCYASSSGSSDESRSYILKSETAPAAADHRHHLQHQQQLHLKQNDRLTPTHSPLYNNKNNNSSSNSNRVDLESFRHYNTNNNDDVIVAHDVDDDGLRLSSRHLRRQQISLHPPLTTLQRSRSISTDDLSTEWDTQIGDTEEPSEWRRVSKLRRSFQSSTTKTPQTYNSPTSSRRPLDLPTNSVSVSKIRAELENSRRLNTVMKNNHVDLAALSSILNATNDKEEKSPLTQKRSTILTAESLKEIRGKLKKLSDESLYKEDFVINQQQQHPETIPELEHIVNDQTKIKRSYHKSPERYRVPPTTKPEVVGTNKHTTNSLESRVKYKDTNSSDWHLRRKSYGFEKMSPPEKAMLRMDASTDSGLGRSGELQNWSPTSDTNPNNRTVVHLGETVKNNAATAVQRRYRPQKSYEESEHSNEDDMAVSKRHSIAVDESQYVRDNSRQTTQIHLNGFYEPGNYSKLIHSTESTTTTDFLNRGQQKRVEFSKTEVHFATESGRVNIVETDSKPPPTNNFRRRKSRSSSVGPLQSLVKSATTVSTTSSVTSTSSTSSLPSGVAMPVTLFGDDNNLRKKTIASTTVAYRAPLVGSPEPKDASINVTVSMPNHAKTFGYSESSRSSYASTSGVDTTDCDTDEMTSLRGILKNKPAKPKPYVLGENIDKADDLWGVQLKPIQTKVDNAERAFKTDSPPTLLTTAAPQKTVAERIQELGSAATAQTNGFSTKINVSLGSPGSSTNNWEETGLVMSSTQRRPSVQELLMQDLKEHQKILDEGLKSTTLIIKTMRSASEFDEAMRRLSIASIEAAAVVQPTVVPMLRSNSYQESTQSYEYLDADNVDGGRNLYKSTSFSSTSSWSTMSSARKYSNDSRKTSTDSGASFPRKDSMPRLSFLGNEQIPVSQQLQRLRLIYDAATISQDDEDSADEEVKSYFKGHGDSDSGGGTQESSSYEDDHYLEHSNSWSRLKASNTIWKIDTDNGGEQNLKIPLDKTDLPTSNVMSIKLHSPQVTTEVPAPLKVVPPVAKPRTITIQETQPPKIHTATTVKQAPYQTSLPTKDSLKIIKEARGARQLREHELSYFGVPISTSEDEKPKSKYTSNANFRNSPKRSLPMRKLSEEHSMTLEQEKRQQQWQLDHDKPDLLKHNPIVSHRTEERQSFRNRKPAERTSLKKKAELDEEDEHLYENIANEIKPVFKVKASTPPLEQYDRKMDLKRDAMILSEMNRNADQTLRELSDEAALKDRRRRSSQRRNSKPLETIDEKTITERINDTCIAVKVSRGTYSSEARKTSRHSTPSPTGNKPRERTSSQSSVECCPRARSRSLSSEKEYENIKSKPSRSSQMVKHKSQKPSESRSSSLDSQRSAHSQYSSGDEQQQQQHAGGSFRREDRSRTKTKRISNSTSSNLRDKHREDKPIRQATSQQQHGDTKRISSTTRSSTHRERVECKHDNALASTIQQHRHHPTSSGLQRSTAASSSGRRPKEDLRDSQRIKRSSNTASGRSTSERHDSREHSTSSKHATRSSRDDERNSSQRSSSHRLERGDKDKERNSKSSKGHSSRSTSHHHHERSTNPDKLTTTTTTKDSKTKSANIENTTHSKNAQHHHQRHHQSKDRSDSKHHRSKRDEDSTEQHVHGLKSAIIKTTTKLRDKSRSKKEKK